ncbi:hypothetical protein AR158_c017R [Paramecium bursaria Chlorella virus AR158]|uniref:hypothetical protein n=1 Tax=Paramecium bursaria Chlorella virus AR158 TaxID=380598 RepID=UPI00015AA714|nr:hypothetical protein AR158_c017R [Paramecium bursaria Chlorella virus AR158]ABU43563.1 hypothetical protein AR158_c017R [Paramecium bursaria Chlorella virus AR158]
MKCCLTLTSDHFEIAILRINQFLHTIDVIHRYCKHQRRVTIIIDDINIDSVVDQQLKQIDVIIVNRYREWRISS